MGGGRQQKQPTREGGRDDNDGTIIGSNGFVRRLKQQSTNKGGTRNERGEDGDNGVGLRRLIQEERSKSTMMGNQRALTAPSSTDATG